MSTRPAIDLLSGGFWGTNPLDELAWMRRNDPVFFDDSSGLWGVTKYDHIRECETDPQTFSNAGGSRPSGPTPMMIDTDDPIHARRRALVQSGFTPKHVRALRAVVERLTDHLIDRVETRDAFDLVTDVAAWLPLQVIGDFLGMEAEHHPTLLEWSDDLLRALGSDDEFLLRKQAAAFDGWYAFITDAMAARRDRPTDDLVSTLVHAEIDGSGLSDEEIVFDTLLILIGGDETTRHVITGGAYQLLRHRDRWERLRADRSLLNGAVEEMLRWVSPIKSMTRHATRDVDLHGKRIEEGQMLLMLYPSANRDEDHFADPDVFDITRSPNDHIAFGVGPHFCLGASLARLELRVMFDRLLDRLPDLRLLDEAEPAYRPANFVSGYESMPVAS
jgi:cytochrome P450 family 142 subfamily A polypeptide 1